MYRHFRLDSEASMSSPACCALVVVLLVLESFEKVVEDRADRRHVLFEDLRRRVFSETLLEHCT